MMNKGLIIRKNGDEILFDEWAQKNNLETFVVQSEEGLLEIPIDPSTEYYDSDTGKTYFEAIGNEFKTVILF